MILYNGQIIEQNSLRFSMNELINFGHGCFETLRLENEKIEDLDLHLKRAHKTLKNFLTLSMPPREEFIQLLTSQLTNWISKEKDEESLFRLKIIFFEENFKFNYLAFKTPFVESQEKLKLGVFNDLDGWFAPKLCEHKLTFNLAWRELEKKIKTQGYDGFMLVDRNGFVKEANFGNLFFVSENQIKTPPLRGILPGIMRQRVINFLSGKVEDFQISNCFKKNELSVREIKETSIHWEELVYFKTCFLTNALRRVALVEPFFI